MKTVDWRKIIREVLRLLASEEEQLAYEKNVPHVDITTELLCGWFDDSYHPENDGFRSCFKCHELDALASFGLFYNERSSRLPESQGTVRTWLQSSIWQEVMSEAKSTLDQIAA